MPTGTEHRFDRANVGVTGALLVVISPCAEGSMGVFPGGSGGATTGSGDTSPTYNRSTVQTFYATLTGGSHLTPIGDAADERAPAIAWLRLWVYNDQAARRYFDGADCILCKAPWTNPQKKNWK